MIGQFLKLNVSTLLVLPLLEGIQGKLRYQKSVTTTIPLLQLLFEGGLEKTYLYNDMSKQENCLHCVFNYNVSKNLFYTTKPWASLNEILLASPNFRDFRMHNDLIMYSLEIPEEYWELISQLEGSKYSQLPDVYKEALAPKLSQYVPLHNDMGNFLISRSIPKKIVTRDERLLKEISKFLNIKEVPEGFKTFDYDQETLRFL